MPLTCVWCPSDTFHVVSDGSRVYVECAGCGASFLDFPAPDPDPAGVS